MIYETEQDRDNQDTAQWLLEYVGYEVQQTSTKCSYDFILSRKGQPVALAEFKYRKKLYNPIKVDAQKLRQLHYAATERGCTPIFLISTPKHPLLWTEVTLDYPTSQFLRTRNGQQRNETTDTVFEIPISEFNHI